MTTAAHEPSPSEPSATSAPTSFPRLRQVVLDTPQPRALAEFYRRLLGLAYLPGDEPDEGEGVPDWLVLVDSAGIRQLAFQLSPDLPRSTWPDDGVPQMMHLDLVAQTADDLEQQKTLAMSLGAVVLHDGSDEEEPIYIFADLSGHPFCIFVSAES